jgi:hypothetical protein
MAATAGEKRAALHHAGAAAQTEGSESNFVVQAADPLMLETSAADRARQLAFEDSVA